MLVWVLVFGCCHMVDGAPTYKTEAECGRALVSLQSGRFGDPEKWSCKSINEKDAPPPVQHHH